VPLHWLRSMTQRDLALYQRHTARRMFPGRRVEMLLAQVSMVLAQVNGQKDVRLSSFLFDPPEDPEDDADGLVPDAEAAAEALNFRPRARPARTDNPKGDAADGQQPG
jgi:hypothetical protein